MDRKYFKPKSLTWWASVVPLLLGLVIALGPLWSPLEPLVAAAQALTGNMAPAVLINGGLAGIGLRGALR